MKTRHFILSFLVMICALNYAQTSAEASGIAIQGIARDDQNTARINQSITLTFELYYIDSGNSEIQIGSPVDANLTTDNFGVFSYVLEPGVANNSIIANHQAYLRISEGSTTISNEKLKHVPYAIAANNGVPTGSIMPYVGNTAPEGWVLCDGQTDLNSVVGGEALIALLGTNTVPDLRGFFLRGAGSNSLTSTETFLNQTQDDDYKRHNHGSGSLQNSTDGEHIHPKTESVINTPNPDPFFYTNVRIGFIAGGLPTVENNTSMAGDHTHAITGNTEVSGGNAGNNPGDTETRPVNYGVNYIIKL